MGKVYLVGAGPGAPDLLTLRSAEILKRADVVFHDALVHPQTLALAQPLFVDSYELNRATGSFILIDEVSNQTVGAGMIDG